MLLQKPVENIMHRPLQSDGGIKPMKRNAKKSIVTLLAITLAMVTLFSNMIFVFAEERDVTDSGVSGSVTWTFYSDGELRLEGDGNISAGKKWDNYIPQVKKISIGSGVTTPNVTAFYDVSSSKSAFYESLESVSVDDGNTSFSVDDNGVLYTYEKNVLILFPSESKITEYKVSDNAMRIAAGAFAKSKNLVSVTLPAGLSILGEKAFYSCERLENINLSDTVIKTIDESTFEWCKALKKSELPETVTEIKSRAFYGSSELETIDLNSGLTRIGSYVFAYCRKLTYIVIPDTVTFIGGDAFSECAELKTVEIPKSVTYIGHGLFTGCKNLQHVEFLASVTDVSSAAFYGCEKLTFVELSETITSIGTQAFSGTAIESIVLPKNLKEVGYSAFEDCKNIKNIYVSEENTYLSSIDGVLFNADKTILIRYPMGRADREYTIPETVKSISQEAFKGATKLENINVTGELENISQDAFLNTGFHSGDNSYKNWDNGFLYLGTCLVDIRENEITDYTPYPYTTLIASHAFEGSKLTEMQIPNGVKYINTGAFRNCTSLKNIALPDSLQTIGTAAFSGCTSLTDVDLPEKITTVNVRTFYNCTSLVDVTFNGEVTGIGEQAFENCKSLVSIDLSNVENIHNKAFFDCKSIASMNFSEKLESIGEFAFYGCGFETVTIPSGVLSIGLQAFQKCSNLKEVKFNANNCAVGKNDINYATIHHAVFSYNDKLEEFTFGKGVTEVPANVCQYVSSLETVIFDDVVTAIGDNAFRNCTNIKCIDLSKVSTIGNYAFSGCASIESIEFFDDIKSIGQNAFSNCGITKLTIPSSVTIIGENAFSNCTELEKVYYNASNCSKSNSLFLNCSNLAEINFGENITVLPEKVCWNTSNLQKITFEGELKKITATRTFYKSGLKELHVPETVQALSKDALNYSNITDIYYGSSKADWKNLMKGEAFDDSVKIHYTLKNADGTVIINHTDDNFDRGAGNIELIKVTGENKDIGLHKYEKGEFYNTQTRNPIQVVDIKLVGGPAGHTFDITKSVEGTFFTVRIKINDEIKNSLVNGIRETGYLGEINPDKINYENCSFVFDVNGEERIISATDNFINKFKIIHFYSDATKPNHFDVFLAEKLSIKEGYFVLETNHFSDFAIFADDSSVENPDVGNLEFENPEIQIVNGEKVKLSVITSSENTITFSSSDGTVATVDENGVVTAKKCGEAEITAKDERTGITAVCKVTVLPRQFTLTWNVDGEKTEEKVNEGDAIIRPKDPVKDGYRFVGWTPDIHVMPSHNLEITAVFEKIIVEEVTVKTLKLDSKPTKLAYTYKIDSLDLNGMRLTAEMTDGTQKDVGLDDVTVSGFDSRKTGAQTITVEYEEKTVEFEITVERTWWQWLITIFLFGWIWY